MTSTEDKLEAHVVVETSEQTGVEVLQAATQLPRQAIKSAMNKGAVWLTRGNSSQRLRRASRSLQPGDEVHLYYDPRVLAEAPPPPTLIADLGGYSVWRKPCGMRSQGSKWGDHCTIMRWAEQHLEPERTSFTVHRLDLAANGLILIAHSKRVAAALGKLFHDRQIDKQYKAVVHGEFRSMPLRIDTPVNDKTAVSEVTLERYCSESKRSLVSVRIETGRKHQIRRHLADIGYPIVGDRLYGRGEADGADLQLTACQLAFHCPVNDAEVEYTLDAEWLPRL